VFEWEAKTLGPQMHEVFGPAFKVAWAFYAIGAAQLVLAWRMSKERPTLPADAAKVAS
jgi:hypothetical protein